MRTLGLFEAEYQPAGHKRSLLAEQIQSDLQDLKKALKVWGRKTHQASKFPSHNLASNHIIYGLGFSPGLKWASWGIALYTPLPPRVTQNVSLLEGAGAIERSKRSQGLLPCPSPTFLLQFIPEIPFSQPSTSLRLFYSFFYKLKTRVLRQKSRRLGMGWMQLKST